MTLQEILDAITQDPDNQPAFTIIGQPGTWGCHGADLITERFHEEYECDHCWGDGYVLPGQTCSTCDGTGSVYKLDERSVPSGFVVMSRGLYELVVDPDLVRIKQ